MITRFHPLTTDIHTLYQQFCVIDPEYAKLLDFIRILLLSQQQVDEMQRGIVLCPEGQLSDEDIWEAYQQHSDSTNDRHDRR